MRPTTSTRMPFWYRSFQCAASRCQISTGAQKPPRSSKSPPLVGTGLSKYTFSRNKRRGSSLPLGTPRYWGGEPMLPSPEKCVLMVQSPWWLKYPCHVGVGRVLGCPTRSPIAHSGGYGREPAQVGVFRLGGLAGALLGLPTQGVQQADLHVQRDALQLDRVQVGQQVDRRAGARHQLLPQGHAHGRAVVPAPAQERRSRASGLLGQSHGQQMEGMPTGLLQHLSLRQADQLVAHGEALAGPGLQVPFTFKRL